MIFHPFKPILRAHMVRPNTTALSARWLRRLRRRLAGSGLISQCADQLAREDGTAPDQWTDKLRNILSGAQSPEPDLILRLEKLIARPRPQPATTLQGELAL